MWFTIFELPYLVPVIYKLGRCILIYLSYSITRKIIENNNNNNNNKSGIFMYIAYMYMYTYPTRLGM